MAYSIVEYTASGSNALFSIPFPYIEQTDVLVYKDNVLQTKTTDYTFQDATTVLFNSNPTAGVIVKLKRDTQKNTKLVDFTDGSILSSSNLDLSADQMLYVTQELYDSAATNVEGEWTPTAVFVSGTASIVPILNTGTYVKIGSYVVCSYTWTCDYNVSSAVYDITLPFAPRVSVSNVTITGDKDRRTFGFGNTSGTVTSTYLI